jgi:porin
MKRWLSLAVIGAGLLLREACYAAEPTPTQDFEALRIRGLTITLPSPRDTIDPDVAGIRSSLAAKGIGYVGFSGNSFYYNMLPAERSTFGKQAYNGQKPTFFTNNVLQLIYDLGRHGVSNGQVVIGGVCNFDTWGPAGPNALSLATLSYYQTLLNGAMELKVGYLANVLEYWGPLLAGSLSSSIFGPNGSIPIAAGLSSYAWTKPGFNIKINAPGGLYDKLGLQRASSPDGPFAEKTANPSGLDWSTPNAGFLAINELGYRIQAAPGRPAIWLRAASIVNTSRYVDYETGKRAIGNYAAYLLADRQFVQLSGGPAARGAYAGFTATYAPPKFNRFSQYYELRCYGIGLLSARPGDMVSLVVAGNLFSDYLVQSALHDGRLAHGSNFSITAAYAAPIAPGLRVGIGLGYTNHPTPVIYTPQSGSALNLLANTTIYL